MNAETDPGQLRTAHRATLVLVALLAGLAALQPRAPEEPAPDPSFTAVAFAFGVGTIVLRRLSSSPVITESTRLTLAVCTYACGVALAGLGSYLAMDFGQARTGLAFALGAFILCLRPIAPPAPKR